MAAAEVDGASLVRSVRSLASFSCDRQLRASSALSLYCFMCLSVGVVTLLTTELFRNRRADMAPVASWPAPYIDNVQDGEEVYNVRYLL